LKEVRIEPDSIIADQISFNSPSNTISYNGEEIESITSAKIVQIKITLVNSLGENLFEQTVMVFPPAETPSDQTESSAEKAPTIEESAVTASSELTPESESAA